MRLNIDTGLTAIHSITTFEDNPHNGIFAYPIRFFPYLSQISTNPTNNVIK